MSKKWWKNLRRSLRKNCRWTQLSLHVAFHWREGNLLGCFRMERLTLFGSMKINRYKSQIKKVCVIIFSMNLFTCPEVNQVLSSKRYTYSTQIWNMAKRHLLLLSLSNYHGHEYLQVLWWIHWECGEGTRVSRHFTISSESHSNSGQNSNTGQNLKPIRQMRTDGLLSHS